MGDTQTTKAAETARVKQKTEDRPPHEREYAPSAFPEATLFRAAASDDPTIPPQHLARVLRRLAAPHQKTGFLLQCQRRYGNAYVQRMISSRDNGHSSPLKQEAHTQEEPIARQVTALQSGTAPDVATAYAEEASSLGGPENIAVQTEPQVVLITPNVQRQKEKDDEEDKPLQSKSAGSLVGSFDAGEEVEVRLSQSKGGGSPLPESVRAYMEPRFGADFSDVRVHTGSDAVQMNRDVGAYAFTHGADIYYGAGSSPANLQLTAHELTHVVQQTGAVPLQAKKPVQPAQLAAGDPAVSSPHGALVQREENKDSPSFVETLAWEVLDEVSPSLAPIVRKGPEGVFDWIKERASEAAAGVFNTLMTPVKAVAGVGAKLSEQFMPLLATLQDAAAKISSNDCSPLQQAAEKIEHIAEQIITPIIETVQPIVAKIQDFLGEVWDKLGAPIWEWIQQYASQRWQEIKQLATWIWQLTEPMRLLGQEAWEWLKKKIGIGEGPEGENGILQWVQAKLQSAWDWLKQQLEPFSKQLAVIKGVIVEVAQIVSPEGPIRAITAVASQAGTGIGWIKDNFGNGDAIVKARVYLEKTLIPPLLGALQKLGSTITGLAGSVSGALNKLANSLVQAAGTVSGSLVSFAASAVQWIANQIEALAGWANQQLTSLAATLQSALGTLHGFLNTFLEFLGKVGSVILDVWRLPLFLAEKVWNWVPACIRDPIVDFVIPIILRQIELFEELVRDNDAWQKTKAEVMKLIRQVFVDHDLMGALKGTFDLILRTFNIPADLAVTVAKKALAAWDIVVKKPLEFIKNTVRALGHGFKLLWDNLTTHLEYGIKGWLLGSIADKDIQFPNDWTKPREVFGFVIDLLGLSVSHIFDLLKTRINPRLVTKAQTWITRFQGAWNWITSMIDTSKSPAENAKGVMDKAKDFGKSILTGVVEWVSAKVAEELAILAAAAAASGGLSEVVDIARRIYKAMVSAKRWAGRILEMANETLDDIAAIASGAVEKAGVKFKDIMHKGMPVVIGFLADQVGLGGVGPAMRNIVDKLRAKVDEAVLWLIDKVKSGIEAVLKAAKKVGQAVVQVGVPEDPNERLGLAARASVAAARRLTGRVTQALLNPILAGIKIRYGLKDLRPYEKSGNWWVKATINPEVDQDLGISSKAPTSLKESAPIFSVDFSMNGSTHTLSVRPSETAELRMASSTEDTLSHRIQLAMNRMRRAHPIPQEQIDALRLMQSKVRSVERQIRRYPPQTGGVPVETYPIEEQLRSMTVALHDYSAQFGVNDLDVLTSDPVIGNLRAHAGYTWLSTQGLSGQFEARIISHLDDFTPEKILAILSQIARFAGDPRFDEKVRRAVATNRFYSPNTGFFFEIAGLHDLADIRYHDVAVGGREIDALNGAGLLADFKLEIGLDPSSQQLDPRLDAQIAAMQAALGSTINGINITGWKIIYSTPLNNLVHAILSARGIIGNFVRGTTANLF